VRELRPEISEGVEAVVMRSLARNREYRPLSAAALGRELAGGSPDAATRSLPRASGLRASAVRTEPLRRAPTRHEHAGSRFNHRLLLGTVVLLLVVAAIVIAVAGRSGGDNSRSPGGSPAPDRVEPVSQTGDPATDGQSLADWLRANSG